MRKEEIKTIAAELFQAEAEGKPIESITGRFPSVTIEDAYHIQKENIDRKVSRGCKVVGKKIGLTSKAMQVMMKVNEPDYGFVLDNLVMYEEEEIVLSSFIQPKLEPELAFIMKQDLKGPGINVLDVLKATSYVVPVFEVIDSRIRDWKIKIQDTIADNASCARVILGSGPVESIGIDLKTTGLVLRKNGRIIDTAAGAAVLGNPAHSVAWLCNKLHEYEMDLKAGEIILSGSFVGAVDIQAGDSFEADFGQLGTVRAIIS